MNSNTVTSSNNLFLIRVAAVMMVMVLASVGFIYMERSYQETPGWRMAAFTTFIVLFTVAFAFIFYCSYKGLHRQGLITFWVLIFLNIGLHFTAGNIETVTAIFCAFCIGRIPDYYNLRTGLYFVAGAVLLYLFASYFQFWSIEALFYSIILIPVYLFVLGLSYTFVRERALTLELRSTQTLLAQSSRQNERMRISRDLHDILGHHMTALILNLEIATHKTSGEGLAQVELSKSLAKLLLSDLRTAVSDLRDSASLDFHQALQQIVDNTLQLEITLDIESGLEVYDVQIVETLLRSVQESLTNSLRHAGATTCIIRLYHKNNELLLNIEDDGSANGDVNPGNGLNGMLERVEALSGQLNWGRKDKGGFYIHVSIPLAGLSS